MVSAARAWNDRPSTIMASKSCLHSDSNLKVFYYPRESKGISFYRRWFVCLSVCVCLFVTTITKRLWTDLYQILREGSYGEREDQVRVSLRSVEGCGSNGQKLRKPATVYISLGCHATCTLATEESIHARL